MQFIKESKERRWYHGTKNWAGIEKSGHMIPHEGENHEIANQFTTDKQNAREYAGKKGHVISISHKDLRKFKHKTYSSLPRGFRKKYNLSRKEHPYTADTYVYDKIPAKHLKIEEESDHSHKDLAKSIEHAKGYGVHMAVAPDSSNQAWEIEEIHRKTDKKGSGSTALKHLMKTADKHGKVLYLNAAGRKGDQKKLEGYYSKHGFKHMKGRGTLPGDMARPIGKNHLEEGASASHLSKHIVKCPVCEGKKKEPACKRCNGTGKLEGNVKISLDKQNTGVHSRMVWIKKDD